MCTAYWLAIFFYIAKQWPLIWLLFVNSFWFSILIAKPEAISNSRSDSIILKIQLIKNFLHNWIFLKSEFYLILLKGLNHVSVFQVFLSFTVKLKPQFINSHNCILPSVAWEQLISFWSLFRASRWDSRSACTKTWGPPSWMALSSAIWSTTSARDLLQASMSLHQQS